MARNWQFGRKATTWDLSGTHQFRVDGLLLEVAVARLHLLVGHELHCPVRNTPQPGNEALGEKHLALLSA